nr:hypothetical protein [Tanacetum cinerariifolium]
MLNKENYVPWSSCLLCYAKSGPNGKLIYNSIINGPYVRRMIPEPGDAARTVLVPKTFHEHTDDELTEVEVKHMEADDQAIQTILFGLPEDIYATIDRIQLQAEEFDLMATASDLDEIKEYTELLEPKPKPHQVQQNDSNVNSAIFSVEQYGGTVEQHPTNVEETRVLYDSLYNNFATKVKKVNSVNRKLRETNVDLTTELVRYKNQEKCFEISQEKYEKLERCYQQSVYQEQCLSKKINALHLNSEAYKFVRDFQSFAKDADEYLAKHKASEWEIKRLLRALVSLDIMSVMQNNFVVDTSNLQNELEPYYDMQQKIERLQAQFGDQKGKHKNTPCVSDTLDPFPQKLKNDNVELEFQVRNYKKENAHLKTAYKNLFYFINVKRGQTKLIINSFQNKLHDTIYENAKLRAQLFNKVSKQKDTTKGTSTNTKFANQSTERNSLLQSLRNKCVVRQPNAFQSERPKFSKTQVPQKVDKTNDLSNPVTSNSVPNTNEPKVLENDKGIAPGMFRINPFKNSRELKFVPNKPIKASVKTNMITVSQPHVVTKKAANSDLNGFSSTGIDITTKTRRLQPRSNIKNDKVPSASKCSHIKNKEVEVEDHPRNLPLSKNKKHISSECNNIKLAIRNDKSKIVCAMCKQFLITANHDVCLLNYMNGMNSRSKKQKTNVSNIANQRKHKAQVWKPKNVGSKERLASPKPSKPRMHRRWSPTRNMFYIKGKLNASSESKWLSKYVYDSSTWVVPSISVILGFADLQWGNILITRVYFVKGLGHNLFSAGQFCDSDLEATSTKSWLWHQRLSHLNFNTINDLARNDLVTGLPKFKYHKEYLCPSCKQGKSKRASHPPKPVLNSKQRSKDEAPEEIKTFLKKIIVLLQVLVIIVRTKNGTEFKNQVLQEYFNSAGISHQSSFVRTP